MLTMGCRYVDARLRKKAWPSLIMMNKEDFVNEIFMNAVGIALTSLSHKELLTKIGEREDLRQSLISYLKGMSSEITFLLNGLRSEDDFQRYSVVADISQRKWRILLKDQNDKVDIKRLEEYSRLVKDFMSLFDPQK